MKAMPIKNGFNGDRTVRFPRNPADVPNSINIAGARQHDVVRNEKIILVIVVAFSFFISIPPEIQESDILSGFFLVHSCCLFLTGLFLFF